MLHKTWEYVKKQQQQRVYCFPLSYTWSCDWIWDRVKDMNRVAFNLISNNFLLHLNNKCKVKYLLLHIRHHRRSFLRQNDIAFVVFSYLFIFVLKWNKHCCSHWVLSIKISYMLCILAVICYEKQRALRRDEATTQKVLYIL